MPLRVSFTILYPALVNILVFAIYYLLRQEIHRVSIYLWTTANQDYIEPFPSPAPVSLLVFPSTFAQHYHTVE